MKAKLTSFQLVLALLVTNFLTFLRIGLPNGQTFETGSMHRIVAFAGVFLLFAAIKLRSPRLVKPAKEVVWLIMLLSILVPLELMQGEARMQEVLTLVTYLLCFAIVFEFAYFHRREDLLKLTGFMYRFVLVLGLCSLLAVYFEVPLATYSRYNPFGPNTLEYRGVFRSTNFASAVTASGLFFGLWYRELTGRSLLGPGVLFCALILIVLGSRTYTVLALGVAFCYLASKAPRFILLALWMLAMVLFVEFHAVMDRLSVFMRWENIVNRGLLDSRQVFYDIVWEYRDLIGLFGLGAGAQRDLWELIAGAPVLEKFPYLTDRGLHSSILSVFTELGLAGLFCYFGPFLAVLVQYLRNYRWRDLPLPFFLLVFLMANSVVNDDIGVPGAILFFVAITTLALSIVILHRRRGHSGR